MVFFTHTKSNAEMFRLGGSLGSSPPSPDSEIQAFSISGMLLATAHSLQVCYERGRQSELEKA